MLNQTENNPENGASIWSWLIWAYSSRNSWIAWFGTLLGFVNHSNLSQFNGLPDPIWHKVFTFLPFRQHAAMPRLSIASYDSHQRNLLCAKFLYLVMCEGEDNQTKAECMLKEYPYLASQFISEQRLEITDPVGRHFTHPMSAYEYAFWAGDTRMYLMMESFMDEDTQARVFQQRNDIMRKGVSFILNGELIRHSKHFDFQPIFDAYDVYIDEARRVQDDNPIADENWSYADKLWVNIGKELAKVPIHVAQEYCSNQSFTPHEQYLLSLKKPNLKRTVEFWNKDSGHYESWFLRGKVNPNLGIKFSIYKNVPDTGTLPETCSDEIAIWGHRSRNAVAINREAIKVLYEERIVKDRRQTFDNLKPAELRPQLTY